MRNLINEEINNLGQAEQELSNSIINLKNLQLRELGNIIKSLEIINQQLNELRVSLLEIMLDEPESSSSEDDS